MLTKFLALAANTFVETIRQPIFGVVVVATLILMPLNVGLAAYTLKDDDKLLVELGLSTLLLSGLFLSSFSATSVLTREIENKTVLTVVSKPVSRSLFLAGKYMGLFWALALAFYICFLGFIFSIQHKVLQTSADEWHAPVLVFGFGGVILPLLIAAFRNFLNGKDVTTTAVLIGTPMLTIGAILTCFLGRNWELQPFSEGAPGVAVIMAGFLVFCAVMVLAAIALAVSTRLGQVMTLLTCLAVLLVGLITDYLLADAAAKSTVADIAYNHIPNFSFFWVIEAVNDGRGIPVAYFAYTSLYALLIVVAALLMGTALFQRREVG